MKATRLLVAFLAASAWAHRLPIHLWTASQGLPRNSVACLAPGPDGIIWICTSEGLARYNGYAFRVFGPDEGLPSRIVLDMEPARSGGYWVVTRAGVCRIRDGAKIGEPCRLLEGGPASYQVGQVFESRTGQAWLLSGERLWHISDDARRIEPTSFEVPKNETLLTIADLEDGALLVSTDYAVYEWTPGHPTRNLSAKAGTLGAIGSIRDAAGNIWLATNRGLFRLRLSGPGRDPVFDGDWLHTGESIGPLARARDGTIWYSTGGNLGRFEFQADGGVRLLATYTPADGLPGGPIREIAIDPAGNLWGASEGIGVFRIQDSGITAYSGADGLDNARIASIFEDRKGRLVVTIGQGRMRASDGDRFQTIPIPFPRQITGYGWGSNQFGLQAHDGEWWIPSDQGLVRFAASDTPDLPRAALKAVYDERSGLGCNQVFQVFEDSTGDVWISCNDTRKALVRWDRKLDRFQRYPVGPSASTQPAVMVIREAGPGRFWVGTERGIFRLAGDRFDAVPLGAGSPGPPVRDLLIDARQRLWVAASGAGLWRCDLPGAQTPVFSGYTTKQGLSANSVRALAASADGFIYAGTVRGVDRIDPRVPPGGHRIRHFTSADGMPEGEPNAAYTDSRGSIWLGTLNGLARLDPAMAPRLAPPGAYFTRLRIRGEDVPIEWNGTRRGALNLAEDRNQLSIEFAGTDPRPLAAQQFQYRLIGVSPEWSAPADQLSVNYPALPSGQLRFEVRAVDADGQIGVDTAVMEIFVQSPLWQRWWFLLLAAMGAAALAVLAYRYRVRQLLAIEHLRVRIATDLHDDIGANLSQIAILSEVARRDGSSGLLAEISAIARETVEQMSDIVWAVNPRHDRFESLLHRMRRFAEDTLGGADIQVVFDAGDLDAGSAVPLETGRPLYLAFKEAVNNVARHSGATEATVRFSLEKSTVKVNIADNGRGFDLPSRGEGEGIDSISRRMKAAGGAADWETAPGTGTRLTLTVPARRGAT